MDSGEQKSGDTLNPFQANRLRITCQYIDKLLTEIEEILNTTASKAAFPRYATDIIPAQRRTIEDYIARVRAQLLRILEAQGIEREEPSIPASRAVHVTLSAIDIAAEELKPRYMRGYGEVPESVATELNGIVGELNSLVHGCDLYLSGGVGEDLKARVERLEHSGNDLLLLSKIEDIVRNHGLVEFRHSIAAILDRAEDKSFEIAVFGRVSSGKSSLLNAILESDALPVGVTPITAVPTRIMYADQPSLTVSFSEAPTKRLEISQLREFATEQENPANRKHVARLVLALPSLRLRAGVTFVDTPGLGSLATTGAADTLAYLPKCDLGVVLIDAGSTLTADDLRTITTLQEAAIPVNVLLSKADLIGPEDRSRITDYVKQHIAADCKLDLPVQTVSVRSSFRYMLDHWFQEHIVPLYARSQELRAASLQRKIGALRDSVVASLEARLRRGERSSSRQQERARSAEASLRQATGTIEELRGLSTRYIDVVSRSAEDAIDQASRDLLHAWETGSYGVVVPGQLVRDTITQFVDKQARKLQTEITALAEQLGTDLRQCAVHLDIPDAPAEGEFKSIVRGAPIFETPSFPMVIGRPTLFGFLGRKVEEHIVARRIARKLPSAFYAATEAYWQLVRAWSDSTIRELKRRFESYAETYRAQAGRALGGHELTKGELLGVEDSLLQLRSFGGNGWRAMDAGSKVPAPEEERV
jgi:GTP-binding protein EngB required for normal cell division